MKALSISLAVALGLFAVVGCAAPTEGDEEATAPAAQAPEENVEHESSSLMNTSSSGGAGWSASCKACKDQCDTDYPRGGGPLQTCKNLCSCLTASPPGIYPVAF